MQPAPARLITPVLVAGSLILVISFGARASFGVFQLPIAADFGWPRTEFSLAIAIQNLAWGVGAPIFSAIAERFGVEQIVDGYGLTEVWPLGGSCPRSRMLHIPEDVVAVECIDPDSGGNGCAPGGQQGSLRHGHPRSEDILLVGDCSDRQRR